MAPKNTTLTYLPTNVHLPVAEKYRSPFIKRIAYLTVGLEFSLSFSRLPRVVYALLLPTPIR